MPVKTILFLVAFAAVCGGAIYTPLIAVVGYVLHYQIGPEGQWWAEPVAGWGIRYSFVLVPRRLPVRSYTSGNSGSAKG